MKENHKEISWPLKITVIAFVISILIGLLTNFLVDNLNIIIAVFTLLVVILLGILFDIIGVAVTVAEESPFHARSSRGYADSREAIVLIRNANKVSSFCNDVIGDIAGVISGGLAAAIAISIYKIYPFGGATFANLLLTAVVASITVGGKAAGKTIAIKHSGDIVLKISKVIYFCKKLFKTGKK